MSENAAHDACHGSWCLLVVCDDCGEMLTNPRANDDGLYGICMSHGRKAAGALVRRESCLLAPSASDRGTQ